MAALRCDFCAGKLIMDESREFSNCESCGKQFTVDTMRSMMQALENAGAGVQELVSIDDVLEKVRLLCESSDFELAKKLVEQAMVVDPQNAEVYFTAFMVDIQCGNEDEIERRGYHYDGFSQNVNFQKALRLGDEALRAKLKDHDQLAKEHFAEKQRKREEALAASKQLEVLINNDESIRKEKVAAFIAQLQQLRARVDTINSEEKELKEQRGRLSVLSVSERQKISAQLAELSSEKADIESQIIEIEAQVGPLQDTSLYGSLQWQVLDVDEDNNRALFITKGCIEQMPYHKPGGGITWEGCVLRAWLNTTFYENLIAVMKPRVLEVVNQNLDNGSIPGGNPTNDKVFLLSIDEAKKYLKNDSDWKAQFQGRDVWWWLRSPGNNTSNVADVNREGRIRAYGGNVVNGNNGVRPALWLSLG